MRHDRVLDKIALSGYTLIEVVTVIVILGVMSGLSLIGISYINSLSAENALKALKGALDSARYDAMTNYEESIECIIKKRNGRWCVFAKKDYVICSAKSDFLLKFDSDEFLKIEKCQIKFNKSDGSISSISYVYLDDKGVSISDEKSSFSVVELNVSGRDKMLVLSPLTGRGVIE